jgi:hypothetical protein
MLDESQVMYLTTPYLYQIEAGLFYEACECMVRIQPLLDTASSTGYQINFAPLFSAIRAETI